MKILYVPNDPLEEYVRFKQTYNMYPYKYFDLDPNMKKIFFSYLSPLKSKRFKKGKFEIFRIKRLNIFKNKLLNYFNIADYIKFISITNKLVRRNKIDIIRTYNPHLEGFLSSIIGKLTKTPVVVSVHNDYGFERCHDKKSLSIILINYLQIFFEFFSYRLSTKIFCVSSHLKKEIVKRGISPSKVEVTYNKVELEKFRAINKKEVKELKAKYTTPGKKTFVFLGRFVWQKNIFTMLKALSMQSNKNFELLMISEGPLKGQIKDFIKKNKLEKNVKFLSFVSNNALSSILKIADALILPSLYEGFGIILIEAQAASCPIIVSDIPSVKDIINKDNAWIFPPRNVGKLADTINMFIKGDNKNNINKKVKQGSKEVERFKWEILANNEMKKYKEILRK